MSFLKVHAIFIPNLIKTVSVVLMSTYIYIYQPVSLVGLKLRVPSRLLRYRRIWSVPGNDELTQSRLEVSTLLAAGDKTHSQLLELMPERSGNAHTRNFEQVLKEVN